MTDRGQTLLKTGEDTPMIYIGHGKESVDMYRGNFRIEDYVADKIPLHVTEVSEGEKGTEVNFENKITAVFRVDGDLAEISFKCLDDTVNRFWFRVNADKTEHVYGCGEQMSYFDLRGRHFPLWTSEPGVGRDKTTT